MEFRAIATASGLPWEDSDGNEVTLLSDTYKLRTSHSLDVALSEITFFKDDFESKLSVTTLYQSLALSFVWSFDGKYFGGVVTRYKIDKNNVTVTVASPQFFFDKEVLTSFAFESQNPRRVTINPNYNSEWAYYRSGKPAQLLATLHALKSPIPATNETFSSSWGGTTSEITIDPINLTNAKEMMQNVLGMEYAPLVNWSYVKRDGVYTTMMTHSIDSVYSTAEQYEVLSSWLPDNFAVDIDNSSVVTTGWCSSRISNTSPEQVLFGKYDHQVNQAEPLGICVKTNVDNLQNGNECVAYAKALEGGFPQTQFSFTVPISERFKIEDSTTTRSVSDIPSLNFVLFENVIDEGDSIRGIIAETEHTSTHVTFTVKNAIYRNYTIPFTAYLTLIQTGLASFSGRNIFSELASSKKELARISKIVP